MERCSDVLRLALMLLCMAACDSGRQRPPPSSPATPSVGDAPAVDASTADASIDVAALVQQLPAMRGNARGSNSELAELLELATRGEVADDDISYDSIAQAARVIAGDPGSAPARFTLACLLAERRLHALAAQVLEVLRDTPQCPACTDALLNVAVGGPCAFDEQAAAIGRAARPSATRAAASSVLAKLAAGDAAGIAPLVGDKIVSSSVCSVCDDSSNDKTQSLSRAAFLQLVRQIDGPAGGSWWMHGPTFMFCDSRCCEGPTGMLSHSASFVTSMCFGAAGATPVLTSISRIDG